VIVNLSDGHFVVELNIEPDTFGERPKKVVGETLRVRSLWTEQDTQQGLLFE
jgi:hypothetical protein